MHDIIPFRFEGSAFRVVRIDGDPWFIASDVARLLGYTNPRRLSGPIAKG